MELLCAPHILLSARVQHEIGHRDWVADSDRHDDPWASGLQLEFEECYRLPTAPTRFLISA